MRRVARILSAALATVSLLLFATVLCLWPRTKRMMDTVSFLAHSDTQYSAGTCPHAVVLSIGHNYHAIHDPHDPVKMDFGWSFWSRVPGSTRSYSWFEDPDGSDDAVINYVSVSEAGTGPERNHLGFGWRSTTQMLLRPPYTRNAGRMPVSHKTVAIPLWFVAAILMTWPVVSLTHHLKRRRKTRLGHCLQCGYDLRASRSRCPECGTPVPNPSLEVGS